MMSDLFSLSHLRSTGIRIAGITEDREEGSYNILVQGSFLNKDRFSDINGGFEVKIDDLLNSVLFEKKGLKVIIKGGEPFLQAANIGKLACLLKDCGIPVICETYYPKEELLKASSYNRFIKRLMDSVDKIEYVKRPEKADRTERDFKTSVNFLTAGGILFRT